MQVSEQMHRDGVGDSWGFSHQFVLSNYEFITISL